LTLTGLLVFILLFSIIFFVSGVSHFQDPLFCVFVVLSFTSAVDLIISLEEDGFIAGFVEVYVREVPPAPCHWLSPPGAPPTLFPAPELLLLQRDGAQSIPGSHGVPWGSPHADSSLRAAPATEGWSTEHPWLPWGPLGLPSCCLLPIPALGLQGPCSPLPLSQVAEEQRKWLHRRPQDLGLILVLLLFIAFTFFRGMVVLDCPADSCFEYIYQHEPYLRDPVAYPKVQMLLYLFYVLPFFCLCIYGLVLPGCSWLPDWSLVFAGAVAQVR
ncbi:TM6S2 protein, partial [Upupa epops]|nr:TM6S2 protein [Upupa epops]